MKTLSLCALFMLMRLLFNPTTVFNLSELNSLLHRRENTDLQMCGILKCPCLPAPVVCLPICPHLDKATKVGAKIYYHKPSYTNIGSLFIYFVAL